MLNPFKEYPPPGENEAVQNTYEEVAGNEHIVPRTADEINPANAVIGTGDSFDRDELSFKSDPMVIRSGRNALRARWTSKSTPE